MEAKLVSGLPKDAGWQFEPKWDGFRAIASRRGDEVRIMSKSGKPLDRYFPEIVDLLLLTRADTYVLDGELIVPVGDTLSFNAVQARLHPAASRIARLARETPAQLMLFDCLAMGDDDFTDRPLVERRAALEAFHAVEGTPRMLLSPATTDRGKAEEWLATSGGALDGIVAKRMDETYRSGERAMLKVKQLRSADCVVGGFRRQKDGPLVVSLLLGLYDEAGKLDHVGFTTSFPAAERKSLTDRLEALAGGTGFTGRAPGGPSRWTRDRNSDWIAVRPCLIVEVIYDQVTGNRFRHGTRFHRWRPDKAAAQCSIDQLIREARPAGG